MKSERKWSIEEATENREKVWNAKGPLENLMPSNERAKNTSKGQCRRRVRPIGSLYFQNPILVGGRLIR